MENNMFTEKMIAPCGLDCSICWKAHDPAGACPGCLAETTEGKSPFCATKCKIIRCEKLLTNGWRFCDECPDFPCEDCEERETRYMNNYPCKESPYGNIRAVRERGMDAFLKEERAEWTCEKCGGVVSVHTGTCTSCGPQIVPKIL